jgi:hypothetical protein
MESNTTGDFTTAKYVKELTDFIMWDAGILQESRAGTRAEEMHEFPIEHYVQELRDFMMWDAGILQESRAGAGAEEKHEFPIEHYVRELTTFINIYGEGRGQEGEGREEESAVYQNDIVIHENIRADTEDLNVHSTDLYSADELAEKFRGIVVPVDFTIDTFLSAPCIYNLSFSFLYAMYMIETMILLCFHLRANSVLQKEGKLFTNLRKPL